ncbi:hypothetical protein GCM10009744_31760 [Kribbella alba]|uniref:Uncharacterized protein n=1 Tax=Kribbella alba TaxID=190197 RepID=A0ABP4RC29_9ACTN
MERELAPEHEEHRDVHGKGDQYEQGEHGDSRCLNLGSRLYRDPRNPAVSELRSEEDGQQPRPGPPEERPSSPDRSEQIPRFLCHSPEIYRARRSDQGLLAAAVVRV